MAKRRDRQQRSATGRRKRVEAAGGVVLRRRDGEPEVAVVHRPRYDDWSLPKGKLESGESFEQAALREVEEETGIRCSLGRELPRSSYQDHKGRSKTVRWFLMEPLAGEPPAPFEPNDEIDELRWLAPAEAIDLLAYEHDRRLLLLVG
jgi:8-oxo-dGTP diphosphatase